MRCEHCNRPMPPTPRQAKRFCSNACEHRSEYRIRPVVTDVPPPSMAFRASTLAEAEAIGVSGVETATNRTESLTGGAAAACQPAGYRVS